MLGIETAQIYLNIEKKKICLCSKSILEDEEYVNRHFPFLNLMNRIRVFGKMKMMLRISHIKLIVGIKRTIWTWRLICQKQVKQKRNQRNVNKLSWKKVIKVFILIIGNDSAIIRNETITAFSEYSISRSLN